MKAGPSGLTAVESFRDPARALVLAHMLLANLVLIAAPFTKIAHCVLYPVLQLVFTLGWHFPAATGEHVARTLAKEKEPV